MVSYEKYLLLIFMNFVKTVEMNETSWKNHGGILTKLLPSHLLIATTYKTIYQMNAISLAFYSMVRYVDYLIYISINIIWKH